MFNAVNMWIRNIVIKKQVEDLQLRIESSRTKLNLTERNWDASDFLFKEDYTIVSKSQPVIYRDRKDQKKMMRETEVHKFSDGTLTRILEKLDHMCQNIQVIPKYHSEYGYPARANIKQALGTDYVFVGGLIATALMLDEIWSFVIDVDSRNVLFSMVRYFAWSLRLVEKYPGLTHVIAELISGVEEAILMVVGEETTQIDYISLVFFAIVLVFFLVIIDCLKILSISNS
ncbi:hypothetical protein Tco_0712505 [Tanacetum coccineum]